jgi:hypothetical protein
VAGSERDSGQAARNQPAAVEAIVRAEAVLVRLSAAQEVEAVPAVVGGEVERTQDEHVAEAVARVPAIPSRLVGGERVAPPEAVQDARNRLAPASHDRRRSLTRTAGPDQLAMEGELIDHESSATTVRPAPGVKLEKGD